MTVDVGDAGAAVDSAHWINIENQNAIAAFVPTATTKFATATRTVVGHRRPADAEPGRRHQHQDRPTSTSPPSTTPAARTRTAVTPANGATDVVANASRHHRQPPQRRAGAVDETHARQRQRHGSPASPTAPASPAHGATSGGGDTVYLPARRAAGRAARSTASTSPTGAKDKSGRRVPAVLLGLHHRRRRRAARGTAPTRRLRPAPTAAPRTGKSYTSLVVGPDGKLYAGSIYGQIYRWTINADGTLSGARETINTVRTHATASGWEGAPEPHRHRHGLRPGVDRRPTRSCGSPTTTPTSAPTCRTPPARSPG